jgi:N-carbamoylputrescine amidase
MKITWLQYKSLGNVKDNFQFIQHSLNHLDNKNKADLIILPELCLWDYFCITENPSHFDHAITLDSPIIADLSKTAKKINSVIVFPFFEKRAEGIYHNSVIAFEKDGTIAGLYRKMHIPDDPGFYEKYYFIPGDLGFQPITTSVGKLGVLICWDQWYPEGARLMAMNGADILIYPTAIGWDDNEPESVNASQVDAWQTIMRSHSIANGIHTVAVNRIGREGHLNFWGNSFCSNPFGKFLINDNSEKNTPTTLEIDLNEKNEARKIWPFFRDRRIDKYQDLLKIWGK